MYLQCKTVKYCKVATLQVGYGVFCVAGKYYNYDYLVINLCTIIVRHVEKDYIKYLHLSHTPDS